MVRGRITLNNSKAALQLARRRLGIALLADWLVAEDLDRERLVAVLDDHSAPPAPIYLLTPPNRYTTRAVQVVVDHLAESLAPRRYG